MHKIKSKKRCFLLQLSCFSISACVSVLRLGSLIALGVTVGPIQPINAELAVEVAHPEDENSIVALQQVCGNLFSALLVPVLAAAGTGVGAGATALVVMHRLTRLYIEIVPNTGRVPGFIMVSAIKPTKRNKSRKM